MMGIKLTEKQKKGWGILSSRDKTRILFDGGSRSGKTVLIAEFLVMRALLYPGSRQLAARRHRVHVKASLWNGTFKSYLASFIRTGLYKFSESNLEIKFSNGSRIIMDGLDDAERTEKILGNEYITVYLNEATQLSWEAVQMAMTRLSQTVYDAKGHKALPKLILDCNPRGPRHWLHIAGVRNIEPESGESLRDAAKWARLNWSALDNLENLPAEYIDTLKSLPDIMRDRMLNGIWRSNEGAVYNEFDENIHVVEPFEIPGSWQKIRSIDFGYTNPFVCLWGAVDHDGRLYVYREYYKARERTLVHAENIKNLSGNERIYRTCADHDASERAELEEQGLSTVAAKKDIVSGVQELKKRLVPGSNGKPSIFFFSTLKNTLGEIYEYIWDDSASKAMKEVPLKKNDHAMDALRYMVMELKDTAKKSFYGDSAGRVSRYS